MKKYDLIVVGGGFAGASAALSAARGGAKVLIVEKSNCLGGAASNCLVNPFMSNATRLKGKRQSLSQGIFNEIWTKLKKRSATKGNAFHEEELKRILSESVLEAGVDLLFHAYIFEVNKQDNKIKSITVATKSGKLELQANYFVDATGDAQVSFLANCPTTLGREPDHLCQPMTLCFRVGNVDIRRFSHSVKGLQLAYSQALANGEFINPRENILYFYTPIPGVVHFNTTRVVKKNPTNPFEVTEAEILARKQVYEIYEFMKKHAAGLENSFLMMTAAEIGVRESRMIVGDYILTESDCRACTKFVDAIAACNYDIDIHNPEGSGTSHYYFPEGEYYTIPYRSLIPQTVDNMLVAGRCISSDHGAQASYRIMPTVCCIGEAAGCAIALAVKNNTSVRDIQVKQLQDLLTKNGAFIGI